MDNTITKIYHYDYFSGPQIKIIFNNVWVDDIVLLEMTLHQNKRPLYGYASTYMNNVAAGTVLVTGTFSMNFRADGYLATILEYNRGFSKEHPENGRFANLAYSTVVQSDPNTINTTAPIDIAQNKTIDPDSVQSIRNRSYSIDTGTDFGYKDVWTSEQIQANIKQLWGQNKTAGEEVRALRPDVMAPFNIEVTYGKVS